MIPFPISARQNQSYCHQGGFVSPVPSVRYTSAFVYCVPLLSYLKKAKAIGIIVKSIQVFLRYILPKRAKSIELLREMTFSSILDVLIRLDRSIKSYTTYMAWRLLGSSPFVHPAIRKATVVNYAGHKTGLNYMRQHNLMNSFQEVHTSTHVIDGL